MKYFHPGKLTVLALAVTLSSCATLNQAGRDYGTAIGCAGGALLGAGLTYAATRDAGKAVAGGVVGGAAGCVIGHVWQNRQQELERIAREENLKMQVDTLQAQAPAQSGKPATTTDAGIVAQVEDQGMFPTGSDQLTTDGLRQVRKLANAFKPADGQNGAAGQAVLVVGHTDATGTAEFNQQLSERRARSVGKVLAEAGIAPQNLYFQGVGAARPLADNTTADGRAQNRRVEIVQLESTALLEQRVKQERSNPRYLAHGTRSQTVTKVKEPVASSNKPAPAPVEKTVVTTPANFIDFGGSPASSDTSQLAQLVKPMQSSGFALISKANASTPVASCDGDRPRVMGAVKNLASGQELAEHDTSEYLPGYNGRVWANDVNGNLVTITPIAVLRNNAEVAKQPRVQLVKGYDQNKKGKATTLNAIANTFEGQDTVLYRVFVDDAQAPVSCMDVVLEKFGSKAVDGKLFYDKTGESYVAKFVPVRT